MKRRGRGPFMLCGGALNPTRELEGRKTEGTILTGRDDRETVSPLVTVSRP